MHDTGQRRMLECAADAMKFDRESADESELRVENMKSEMDSNEVYDLGFDGQLSDVKDDTVEEVGIKMPERKKKLKKVPELNVKKKATNPRNDINETFQ